MGSTAVVTNATGALVERLSYDAWGKQRNANGSDATTTISSTQRRGFTDHEMLDEVGLVHMNGRVYDPSLGRFMTADTFIQFDDNCQSYNRYSYVLNNPLSLTDPSGHLAFLAVLGPALGAAVTHALINTGMHWALAGVIGGALAGGVAGEGDLRAELQGAVSGALFGAAHQFSGTLQLPGKMAVHAVAGGLGNEAFGGDFRSGALSAGFAAGVGGFVESKGWAIKSTKYAVVRIVSGGIAAELGGGKFANGAVTAGFGYLMNDLLRVEFERNAQRAAAGHLCPYDVRINNLTTGQVTDGLWGSALPDQARPNCQGQCTNIDETPYTFDVANPSASHPSWGTKALRLNGADFVGAVDPNPNQPGNIPYMNGVYVHRGWLTTTGSEGCLTIFPAHINSFFNTINYTDTGWVRVKH